MPKHARRRFKPTIGNENLCEIGKDNGVTVINLVASKYLAVIYDVS
jgi:hypothetical protein